MTAYLAYSYSVYFSEKEKAEIDKKVKKSQEQFCRGFQRGTQISLSIYSVYLLASAAAYAANFFRSANSSRDTPNPQPPHQ